MNTISSTLGLFALKSYVSVLPEMKKETALKIVGGGDAGSQTLQDNCQDILQDMQDLGAGSVTIGRGDDGNDYVMSYNDGVNDSHDLTYGDVQDICNGQHLPNEPNIPEVPPEPAAPKEETHYP